MKNKRTGLPLRTTAFFLGLLILALCAIPVSAEDAISTMPKIDAKSAVLMEASTGKILGEQNPDEALPPASVTKVMTLLLVMEAIEAGSISPEDMVTVSANAASMGGSQIYLKEGETMSVDDLLKSVVVSSANDAAVALAEHICGSEAVFVARMNARAAELGMKNTVFENTNGLDDTTKAHLTSARDIAIMSKELISHEKILEYSSIWMDTIRDGAFGLTNTNRLIRFYRGANGLKTGSTSRAGFCISATAKRDDMQLIAVIMGADTRDSRNEAAKTMLDWGFANFGVYHHTPEELAPIYVPGGTKSECGIRYADFSAVVSKSDLSRITSEISLPESAPAPLAEGEKIGEVKFFCEGELLGTSDIVCAESVNKISFWGLFSRIMRYGILA